MKPSIYLKKIFFIIQELYWLGIKYTIINIKLRNIFKKKTYFKNKNFFHYISEIKITKKNKNIKFFFNIYYKYLYQRFYGNFENIYKFRLKLIENDYIFNFNNKKINNIKNEILFEKRFFNNFIKAKTNSSNYIDISNFFLNQLNYKPKNFNEKFSNYIKNKKIIFVGPGEINELSLPESNSIIVTTNSNENLISKIKPDIVYFNNKRSREHPEQVQNSIINSEWTILKSYEYFNLFNTDENKKQNLRYLVKYELSSYLGDYNYLALILMDLILHRAQNIFVQNVNFFTSKKFYNDDYRDKSKYSKNSVLISNRLHDPFKTYLLVKYLYNNNYIFGDNTFENLMKISNNEFAKLLDQNYA